jgi:hypothetical protein
VTTSALLDKQIGGLPPPATTNLAFTYSGLTSLDLPDILMRSFPDEFRMDMKARKDNIGDDGPSAPENWDPVWQDSQSVRMLVTIIGQSQESLNERYEKIIETLEKTDAGVALLTGHCGINGANNLPYHCGNPIVLVLATQYLRDKAEVQTRP